MIGMAGALASEIPVCAPSAVLLARDEALRETLTTIIAHLSGASVTSVETVDGVRRALVDLDAVLVVAPGFADSGVATLLHELRAEGTPIVVISASLEDADLAVDGQFVAAPFDVDGLLRALETALGGRRRSGLQRVAQ